MSYINYIFDMIYNILNNIIIPIPIFIDKSPAYFSLFNLFIGTIAIGILIIFINKILDIDSSIFWDNYKNDIKKEQGLLDQKTDNYFLTKYKNADGSFTTRESFSRRFSKKL